MKARNEQITRILDLFDNLNGTKFVGIRGYESKTSGEICDFVVNANFNYGNAIKTTKEILNSLTASDFDAIADMYNVCNEAGTKYGTNKAVIEYLATGKIAKEGTKANAKTLADVKVTMTLAEMRDNMVLAFDKPKKDDPIYESVAKGVKQHIENEKYYIWAMSHWKGVPSVEGTYKESTPKLETEQKNAIEKYCKYVLKDSEGKARVLPTTKYRQFVCEENQLAEVKITGETVTFI